MKKTTTLAAALAFLLLPVTAFAMCGHEQQAQSCADGMVWDAVQKACVKQVSS